MEQSRSSEIIQKKLDVYLQNFSAKDLQDYEDAIFTVKMSKKTRAELELSRLKDELLKNSSEYTEYFSEILRLTKLLKVAEFDSSVLEEIYMSIVKMQLESNSNIRLYSGLSLLKEEYIPNKLDYYGHLK